VVALTAILLVVFLIMFRLPRTEPRQSVQSLRATGTTARIPYRFVTRTKPATGSGFRTV